MTRRISSIALIFVFLTVFVLTSCQQPQTKQAFFGKKSSNTNTESSFIGGTGSVVLSFLDQEPPEIVYKDDSFRITAVVQNNGEYTIPKDKLTVKFWGVPFEKFGYSSKKEFSNSQDLTAKFKDDVGNVYEGARQEFSLSGLKYSSDVPEGGLPFKVYASACFNYGTTALARLCVVGDINNPQKVCNPNSDITVYNSGAPVQIKNMKQVLSGNRLQVTFEIDHLGDGLLFRRDSDCDNSKIVDRDVVHMKIEFSGIDSSRVSCSAFSTGLEGDVKLYNNKRIVTCTIKDIEKGQNMVVPMSIELTYNYYKKIEQTFVVKP